MSNSLFGQSDIPALQPDVFCGGSGNLVIVQEWPSLEGERFSRIVIPLSKAELLAGAIMAVARGCCADG